MDWDRIIAKIKEKVLLDKVNRISPMMAEDATSRYLIFIFMEKFPTLANRVSLSYLASCRGITQSSLSRICKQLSEQ